MRKMIWIAMTFLITLILSGCQVINRPTPQPTPTAVYLAMAANAAPTGAPTPAAPTSAAAPAPATPATAAPAPSPTARPTASARPVPTATAAPDRLMALGVRPSLALRAAPDPTAVTVATLYGSQVLWAEGRAADGRWLYVAYGNAGAKAWAAKDDVRVLGNADSLPIVTTQAVAATAPPAAAFAPGKEMAGRTVAATLNVRGGPGLDQPVIGQLPAGTAVAIAGRTDKGDWLAIRWPVTAPTGTGWVAASLVELTGAATDLPILATQTTTAVAPAPALTGQIAFQTRSGGDIYVVNADGAGLRRVADGLDPAFSPDGTQLAFTRWGTNAGVFVLDLRTGQERRIAGANRPRSPTWSSDGSQLVFAHSTRDYTCLETPLGCYDESTIRQIFGGKDCLDTPQGRYCISDFSQRSVDDTGLARVMTADGAWLDLLNGPVAQSAAWLPGQDAVLFRGKTGLQTLAPGSQPRVLVENAELGSPAPSPDGSRIAAQIYLHDHADIFLLGANGQTQRRLTAPPAGLGRAPNNVAPVWSPDGRTLLFLSDRDGAWRLYRMDADGANQTLFLPDTLGGLMLSYDFAAERVASWSR